MSQYNNDYYQNSGAGGGGGYLTGGSPYGSPGGSDDKSEIKHSLRPVTIALIKKATQAHTDADWRINGLEVGQITLVAQIITINQQATNVTYLLDDGTGRIEARHWLVPSNTDDAEKWSGLSENAYCRVTGHLKTFSGSSRVHVSAMHMRPSTDPHEPYFHLAEVMTVHMILERGMPPAPGQAPQIQSNVNAPGGPSSYTAQSRVSTSQYASLPHLQRNIMEFLATQSPDDGVHVGAIARGIHGTDAGQISDALEALMDGGYVYTIIDESHFLISA